MANNALWRSVALCTTRNRDILTLNEQVVAPPFDGKNVFAISQGLYKHAVFKLKSTPVKAYIVRFYCPDFDNKLVAWGYSLSSIKSLLRFENNLGMSDVSALSGLYPYANYKHCYGEYVTVAGEIVMSYTALMARLTPKYRNRFSSTGGTMRILEYIAQLGDKMGLDRSWQSSPFLSGDTFDAVDDVDEELDDSMLDDDCVPPAPTVKANPPVEVITSDDAMDEDVMRDDTTDEHVVLVDENEEEEEEEDGEEVEQVMASTSTALVPWFAEKIGEDLVQTCNARELWAKLEVKDHFSNWIKRRIEEYNFAEDIDFVRVFPAPEFSAAGNRGKRIDYHVTIDMAKELAMVERNEMGRKIRRYLIACQRDWVPTEISTRFTEDYPTVKAEYEEDAEISTSTALVRVDENQQVIVDSLMIAQQFNRRHKDVLLTISRLNCTPDFNGRNFVPVKYTDKKGEKRPMVTMTRDGVVFLVSKLKGSEAGIFLEKYIEAFNLMESKLQKSSIIRAAPSNDISTEMLGLVKDMVDKQEQRMLRQDKLQETTLSVISSVVNQQTSVINQQSQSSAIMGEMLKTMQMVIGSSQAVSPLVPMDADSLDALDVPIPKPTPAKSPRQPAAPTKAASSNEYSDDAEEDEDDLLLDDDDKEELRLAQQRWQDDSDLLDLELKRTAALAGNKSKAPSRTKGLITLKQFLRKNKIKLSEGDRKKLAIEATRQAQSRSVLEFLPNDTFGRINLYPETLLREVYADLFDLTHQGLLDLRPHSKAH